MSTILTLAILIAVGWVLAYRQAPLWLWTAAGFVTLWLVSRIASGPVALLVWLLWVAWLVLLLLNVAEFRRHFISRPALHFFRNLLPRISQTEQEALDAGTVWWDAELFSGRPNWRRLHDLPPPSLSLEEKAFLDGPAEELCRMLNDWQISHELVDLPPEVWDFIKERGFLGMIIPKKHGGLGFSALAHSEVVMKISTRCSAAAVTVMVPNSLGPAELLMRYGTEAQRERHLARLARGEELPCFALTSPHAGSDAASIPDHAIVCHGEHDGQQVLGLRVTWEKRYITLGPVATLLGLAFQTYDPDHLLGAEEDLGITLAMVPTTHPGVNIGRRHYPAQQAFQNGPTSGKDVFIPMEWVIGGQERVGQGWRMLMNCLAAGRSISLPALSTGALKVCVRTTGAYARVRRQFRVPIGRFEGVEEVLARMAGDCYAVDAARMLTASVLDRGEEPAVISALLKYQATERMRRAVNDAMDVHGGRAICIGPSNYLFTPYQSIPIAITVEGANILTRSLIIFGQGAVRCHPWLLKEIGAAKNTNEAAALSEFDAALCGHFSFTLRNFARAFFIALTGARYVPRAVSGPTHTWHAQLARVSSAFALLADIALMLLGGALKRRERLSGRFADVLGEMYLMSAALKHFEDHDRPREDLPLVEWVCRSALHAIELQLSGILDNFPSRLLRRALRVIVFPLGRRARQPNDRLAHIVAGMVLEPSAARDRLTVGMYVDPDPNDPVGRLEHALDLTLKSEVAEKRLEEAQRDGKITARDDGERIDEAEAAGALTGEDAALLRQAHAAVRRAIDVDHFAASELEPRHVPA
ncbi:MAG: acyl-CoA dehydrogenase [Chromatiales bacterium]